MSTLTLGVNSFATVSEADSYFDAQFNNTDWFNSAQQSEALVTASGILNRLSWKGTARPTTAFPLAWPRSVTLTLPIRGTETTLRDDRVQPVAASGSTPAVAATMGTIPTFIKEATYELALHIIRNGVTNIGNESGSAPVRDLTVGSIRLTFDLSGRTRKEYIDVPSIVHSIIAPYLGENVSTGIGVSVSGGA